MDNRNGFLMMGGFLMPVNIHQIIINQFPPSKKKLKLTDLLIIAAKQQV